MLRGTQSYLPQDVALARKGRAFKQDQLVAIQYLAERLRGSLPWNQKVINEWPPRLVPGSAELGQGLRSCITNVLHPYLRIPINVSIDCFISGLSARAQIVTQACNS